MSSYFEKTTTLHGTVLARVGTKTVRVMIDTGAWSSCICTKVITEQTSAKGASMHRADVWYNGKGC